MIEHKYNENVILVSDHALERLNSRLRWPVSLYMDIISNICISNWNRISVVGKEFCLVKFGVRWVFAFRSEHTVVLKTVTLLENKNNIHRRLFNLATQYAKERSFLQRNKLKKKIEVLLREEGIIFYVEYGRSVKRIEGE